MKKGQAALEFLMTYGWAILVVLAAIAALSYFGILNPSKFTPTTCVASSGVGCLGKPIITNNSVTLSISNGLGYDIAINTNAMSNDWNCPTANQYVCALGDSCTNATTGTIKDGQGVTLYLNNCVFSSSASIVKGDILMNYTNPQSKLTEHITIGVTGRIGS